MAATRDEIVQLARACIGTPFRHQGRLPSLGFDCIGLIIYLSNELELSEGHYENTSYAHFPSQFRVQVELSEHLKRIAFIDAKPADVALIADDGNHSCHVGILALDSYGDFTLIHAAARNRAVVEQRIDSELKRKLRAIFRFRSVREEE